MIEHINMKKVNFLWKIFQNLFNIIKMCNYSNSNLSKCYNVPIKSDSIHFAITAKLAELNEIFFQAQPHAYICLKWQAYYIVSYKFYVDVVSNFK